MKMTLLVLAIMGQFLDLSSTIYFLSKGFAEGNPIFGPDPNISVLVLVKFSLLSILIYFCFINTILRYSFKIIALSATAILGFTPGLMNVYMLLTI